ncbi:MAG: DUF2288 domain-containing protein [Limnospira sp.]
MLLDQEIMEEDLKTQLSESVDEAAWEWLAPHVKRDAVVIVDRQLDLLEVGAAIAEDRVSRVQSWIDEQQIYKPTTEQISTWNGDQSKRFNALIVQPFVLVQER